MFAAHKLQGAGGVGGGGAPTFDFVGAFDDRYSVTVDASNIEQGDLMIASCFYYSGTNLSPETGWTEVYDALYGSFHSVNVAWKIATSTDAANGVTVNNGNRGNVVLIFRPINNTGLPALYHEAGSINSTAQTAASIPSNSASVWVGLVGYVVSYSSHSFSSGVTTGNTSYQGHYAYSFNEEGNSLGSQYSQISAGFEYAWSGCFTIA